MKLVQSLAVLLTLGLPASSALENEGMKLRGGIQSDLLSEQLQRKLPGPPHPKKHSSSSGSGSYMGCLSYTDEELSSSWPYWTSAPDCSYDTGDSDEETEPTYDSEDEETRVNGDDSTGGSGSGGNTVITNQDYVNGTDYDPYTGFNVTQCSTYSNLWLWDLAMSCDDASTYEGCNCTFAEELSAMGLLSCDDADQCNDDCPVCKVCMSVLGCDVTDVPPNVLGGGFLLGTDMIYVIAAAAFVTIVIVSSVLVRRRQQPKEVDGLSVELMSGMSPEEALGKGKAVPVGPAFEPPQIDDSTSYTESVGFTSDIDIESAVPSHTGTAMGVVATGMLLDDTTPEEVEDDSTMASQGSEISESAVMFAIDMTANLEGASMETSEPQLSEEGHNADIAEESAEEAEEQNNDPTPCLDTIPSVPVNETSMDEEEAKSSEETATSVEAADSEETIEESQVTAEESGASAPSVPEETIVESQAPEVSTESATIEESEGAGIVTSEDVVEEDAVPDEPAAGPEMALSEETPEPAVVEESTVAEEVAVANDSEENSQDVTTSDQEEKKIENEVENDTSVPEDSEANEDSAEALV